MLNVQNVGKVQHFLTGSVFDGLEPFPNDAEQKKYEMEEELQTDLDKLKKAKERIKISERKCQLLGGNRKNC